MKNYSEIWKNAPFYSSKFDVYFEIYEEIFSKLRGTSPTFIEIGIQGGGSLFTWREYFGEDSRIIGIDLNPECKKFEKYGFEIHIGDAADENFLARTFQKIGKIDAILDDGGHLFHQQINVLQSAAINIQQNLLVAIEDSSTSFYKEFLKKTSNKRTFIQYAKDLSDILHLGFSNAYPDAFSKFNEGHRILHFYKNLKSISFFEGITVFQFKENKKYKVNLITNNKPIGINSDFRYRGLKRKKFLWPIPKKEKNVTVGQLRAWYLTKFF